MLRLLFTSGYTVPEMIIYGAIMIIVLVFSLSIHEFMHGYAAYRLGDDTARLQGRLTLNPLAHLDPIGALMMLLAGFGWAKPVPVNYNRLTRFKRRDTSVRIVSLAGVTANFLTAFIAYFLFLTVRIIGIYSGLIGPTSDIGSAGLSFGGNLIVALQMLMYWMYFFNLMLMAFNLLPIPPLDGYHFIETFLPYKWKQKIAGFERYFVYIFLALILMGNFLSFSPLSQLISWIEYPFQYIIQKPIEALASFVVSFL